MSGGVLARAIRELRRSAVGWSIAVAGVSLLYSAVDPSIRDSADTLQQYIDNLPEAVKSVIGAEYTTPAGYLRSELFSSLALILFLIFAIGAGSRAIAGEEERRTLDLILSTPVRRRTLISGKALSIVAVTFALAAVLFVVTFAAGPAFGLSMAATRLAGACAMLALLAIAFGAIGLAVGPRPVGAPSGTPRPAGSPWSRWSSTRSRRRSRGSVRSGRSPRSAGTSSRIRSRTRSSR